jgi:hypothetical protein
MRRLARSLILGVLLSAVASPAIADITAFVGTTSTPTNRPARGFAFGMGLLVVGIEFEYASTSEEPLESAPSLHTGMGNVYVQTPIAILGLRPYFTTGGGVYREKLGTVSETGFALNSGGGVKVSLLGPVRARVDYRVFRLRGEPMHDTVHRFYAGLNLSF